MKSFLQRLARRRGRTLPEGAALEGTFADLVGAAPASAVPGCPAEPLVERFLAAAAANRFEVSRVANYAAALETLPRHLPVVLGPQRAVAALPWEEKGFALRNDAVEPALAVVEAAFGVAETGTVAVASDAAPSRLLFLAEEILFLLPAERVVEGLEALWAIARPGRQRALHLISGPSRTADVEQILTIGAHGPRRARLWLREVLRPPGESAGAGPGRAGS